jgi:hypothetical protein
MAKSRPRSTNETNHEAGNDTLSLAYIDTFAEAFPRQQLCLHLSVAIDAKDGVLEEAVAYGVQRHPDQFTLQNCQLSRKGNNTGLFSSPQTSWNELITTPIADIAV